jgi:hypothetical protein
VNITDKLNNYEKQLVEWVQKHDRPMRVLLSVTPQGAQLPEGKIGGDKIDMPDGHTLKVLVNSRDSYAFGVACESVFGEPPIQIADVVQRQDRRETREERMEALVERQTVALEAMAGDLNVIAERP